MRSEGKCAGIGRSVVRGRSVAKRRFSCAAAMAHVGARLLRSWRLPSGLRVELHLTPDIVSRPPGGRCDALANPANPQLVGSALCLGARSVLGKGNGQLSFLILPG